MSDNKELKISSQMDKQDSEHKKFAGTIKGLHSHLRIQLRQAKGDFERVWEEHCQNEELLNQYADAMCRLATDIWTKKPETRIHWCRNVCLEYFLNGGLEKLRQKDERKRVYEMLRRDEMRTLNVSDDSTKLLEAAQETTVSKQLVNSQHESSQGSSALLQGREDGFTQSALPVKIPRIAEDCRPLQFDRVLFDVQVVNSSSNASPSDWLGEVTPTKSDDQHICLPFTDKIFILDVGSCYNPFKEFEEFLAVGVDLCPAVEGVHRCDFLQLEVVQQLERNSPKVDFTASRSITSLPEESFHVVVFSLLLEYLPSPQQRWTCCKKAHRLLMLDGLLLIVSPDSHHQQRNAPMMRSWKMAIESLGFSRWRYVKQEHLHCIAFRKTRRSGDGSSDLGEAAATMLYIPQDLHLDEERHKTEVGQGLDSVSENEPCFMDNLNEIVLDD